MLTTEPLSKTVYLALSEQITADDLLEFLHLAENALNAALCKIHCKTVVEKKLSI